MPSGITVLDFQTTPFWKLFVCVCVCVASPALVAVLESQTWLPCVKGPSPEVAAKLRGVCVCVCVWFRSELGFHLQLPFRSDIETQPLCFLKYLKESLLSFELLRVNMSLTPSHV